MSIDKIIQELKEECSFFSIQEEIQDKEYIEEEKMWKTILNDFIAGLELGNMSDYDAMHYVQAFEHVVSSRKDYLWEASEKAELEHRKDYLCWFALFAMIVRYSKLIKQLLRVYDDITDDYVYIAEYSCSKRGAALLEKRLGPLAEFEELFFDEEGEEPEKSKGEGNNARRANMVYLTRAEYIKSIMTDDYVEYISNTASAKEAFYLYRIAANCGSPLAKYKLGLCYRYGSGTKTDYAKAFDAFSEAADNDVPGAITALGRMYRSGDYVKVDSDAARNFFIQAKDIAKSKLDDSDMQLAYAEAMYGLGEMNYWTYDEAYRHESLHCFSEAVYYYRKCKDKWLQDSGYQYRVAKEYVEKLAHCLNE